MDVVEVVDHQPFSCEMVHEPDCPMYEAALMGAHNLWQWFDIRAAEPNEIQTN